MNWKKGATAVFVLLCLLTIPVFGEDSEFKFKMDLGLGAESLLDTNTDGNSTAANWQFVKIAPDISFGDWGIGLDLVFHYEFNQAGTFQIRVKGDWVPDSNNTLWTDWLELYIAKINYVRYGLKGKPLYVKAGSFDDATIGNGFTMGSYSNMVFKPLRKFFGLQLDLDGNLFGVPYFGIETVVGNFSGLSPLGARVFVRPLAFLDIPVIKNLQIGGEYAIDIDPSYIARTGPDGNTSIGTKNAVAIYGVDLKLPIIESDIFGLNFISDFAMQNNHWGLAVPGVTGHLFKLFAYNAQLRVLGENFVPNYFGGAYDLYRLNNYNFFYNLAGTPKASSVGYYAMLGTTLLDNNFIIALTLDGPFNLDTFSLPANSFPHLQGLIELKEIQGVPVSFRAFYDKYLKDLTDLRMDAIIGADLSYKAGGAKITVKYAVAYLKNDTADPLDDYLVTTKIETSISLF